MVLLTTLRPKFKLSLPALETLSVIAYKQPVTIPEVQAVRGVNVGGVIHTLLNRKLIGTAGRKKVIGRPMMYKTTKEFLVQFGLSDLSELPNLKELEELSRGALGEGEERDDSAEEKAPPETADQGSGRSGRARSGCAGRTNSRSGPSRRTRRQRGRRWGRGDPGHGRRAAGNGGRLTD